jgi:uncharacterized protein YjbK
MKTMKKYGKPPCLFKAHISPDDFWRLAQSFGLQGDWSQMVYMYFDTSAQSNDAELYNQDLRLRVRIKDEKKSLELKDYRDGRHWDIGQRISGEEFRGLLQGQVPEGEAGRIISVLHLQGHLRCIRVANTIRKKIWINDGILVLDMTVWPSARYEVEYRSEQNKIPLAVKNIRSSFCPEPMPHDKMEELWTELVVA